MSRFATRWTGRACRNAAPGRCETIVALCLLSSLSSSGPGSAPPPESVTPCLPCHAGGAGDQVAEWLASPYSETQGGRSCVDCHRLQCGGSRARRTQPPDPAAARLEALRRAVSVTVIAVCSIAAAEAEVAVSNLGIGHSLGAGRGAQALVLEVSAEDRNHTPLLPRTARTRRTLPRLAPFATEVSRHRFEPPVSGPAQFSTRLVLVPRDGSRVELFHVVTECRRTDRHPPDQGK